MIKTIKQTINNIFNSLNINKEDWQILDYIWTVLVLFIVFILLSLWIGIIVTTIIILLVIISILITLIVIFILYIFYKIFLSFLTPFLFIFALFGLVSWETVGTSFIILLLFCTIVVVYLYIKEKE